jgi:hypothetical protein
MSAISDPRRTSFADHGRVTHTPVTELLLDSEAMLRQVERVLSDFEITAGRGVALGSLGAAPEVHPASAPGLERVAKAPR